MNACSRFRTILTAGVVAATAVGLPAAAEDDRPLEKHPGYVDGAALARFADADGTLVEISLRGRLLEMLTARALGRRDAPLASILGDLASMQAVIADVSDDRLSELTAELDDLVRHLEKKGWERFVRVREAGKEEYRAYTHLAADDETIDGLLVLGFTGQSEFLFVNLAGVIDMERIALLSERFGVPGLHEFAPPPPETPTAAPESVSKALR